MSFTIVQGNANDMPLPDQSVDLIVTSPPYWGLRSYRDGGEHYDGQIGSEDSPQRFVDELVGILDGECRRVLKGSGSLWLNLGDKYAGSGGGNDNTGLGYERGDQDEESDNRGNPRRYPRSRGGARAKSLMGLPWRVALALIDRGWILRAEVIWSKPNGLPESVTDRVRRSHEQWFHFTLEPRYYSAVDRIREPHADVSIKRAMPHRAPVGKAHEDTHEFNYEQANHPLGRLPGSVRTVPTQPLIIPDEVKERLGLVDHFAAFPMEWPRWIIEGWSPEKVCTLCGEGLALLVERTPMEWTPSGRQNTNQLTGPRPTSGSMEKPPTTFIVGEACACPEPGPTTPGVVLDPFGGTGTTAGVAHHLGRHGISIDLSADYCRLAEWRITQSGHFDRIRQSYWAHRQESLGFLP